MSNQEIKSDNFRIGEVFSSFYVVPDYQREYVWEAEHVEQLLDDINAGFPVETKNAPEYFIGSIVVCRSETGAFELIDGQQRMTTLFLIICAIRNHIKSLDQEFSEGIEGNLELMNRQIKDIGLSTDIKRGNTSYRVKLQYKDSSNILEKIAEGNFRENNDESTRSIKNIGVAYNTILDFLKSFSKDVEAINKFYAHLLTKVKLIRIETPDVAQALNIFETINDRGVGLDSMDLLKNLLFALTNPDDFDKLKESWKKLQGILFDKKEKPLRFLRYFILSHYDGADDLRENNIYDWFNKNKDKTRHDEDPIGFVDKLIEAANAYCYFLNGVDATGNQSRYMENLKILGGRAARQHLILLLTGWHLSKDLFDRLACEVENLLFTYIIVREPAKTYEKKFIRWAGELRKIEDESELEEFITKHFSKDKTELLSRFDLAFKDLRYHSVPKYRLRYILAKLTQHLDLRAYGEGSSHSWLKNYIDPKIEIEHVFPQQPDKDAKAEFGDCDDPDDPIANYLGNLVLLEESYNSACGNQPYSEKRKYYSESQFLWTEILGGKNKASVGKNTKIGNAVKECEDYPEWNKDAVKKRQDEIGRLARVIWGLDDQHRPE